MEKRQHYVFFHHFVLFCLDCVLLTLGLFEPVEHIKYKRLGSLAVLKLIRWTHYEA